MCISGTVVLFGARILVHSIFGFLLDVIYAPILVVLFANFIEKFEYKPVLEIFDILGKYSTGIWFFHAVFFSSYVSDLFQPILLVVKQPILMFGWYVVLSFCGAFVFQKILEGIKSLLKAIKGSV